MKKYPKSEPLITPKVEDSKRRSSSRGSSASMAGGDSGSFSASGKPESSLSKRLFDVTFLRHPKILLDISSYRFKG